MSTQCKIGRREFLKRGSQFAGGFMLASAMPASAFAATGKRVKVAAVITAFTYRSHAHVILENFVEPYLFNGKWISPDMDVVSLYADQFPDGELGRAFAEKYRIPIYKTINEALCLGGDKLAVDAVLSIGEHGTYPVNEKGQCEYPRKRFFDEIVAVFRRSGKVAPVYNDKHLSYRWDWGKEMYDTSRELNFPFMAGSSVPLAQRRPPLELPARAKIQEAVSIHGGGVESYDFHGLEVLQSMIEARRSGETGVVRVQFLQGDALWKAAADGLWSVQLAQTALDAEPSSGRPPAKELIRPPKPGDTGTPFVSHGILLNYRDGLRAVVLAAATGGIKWHFACQLAGEQQPRATSFYVGPWQNRNLFKALSHAIQTHFRERRAPYPVERTLLVTGILDAEMESRFQGGKPMDTPQLAIAYQPRDYRKMRELGASWKIITEDIPEPKGIEMWRKP
ncbi:MAG: hypothetical protein HY298_12050 [Verrucomicrobia bacterium]|nr:hypothetical protein [Verrucomicrobiota bacterium]